MKVARAAGGIFSALLVSAMATGPSHAATPYLTLTLKASPNPSGLGSPGGGPGMPGENPVTLTGTVTPTGGSFSQVALLMTTGYPPESCTPVEICNLYGTPNAVTWLFPTIDSKITVTVVAPAWTDKTLGFSVQHCVPDTCLVQNATTVIKGPTISGNLTLSPAGVVMPGDVLHFTATGSVNLPPLRGIDVQTKLPAGLADPTNISAGGMWGPAPARYIDYNTDLNPSASYTFDTQVTAPIGTDMNVVLNLFNYGTYSKTVKIHVGPVATATPHPTPHATPAGTAGPPPPAASPPLVAASATASASELLSSSGLPSSSPSEGPSAIGSSALPSASAAPSPPSQGGPISLGTVLLAAGAGGAVAAAFGSLVFIRRRRLLP